jgi:hypothetical protein
MIMVRKQEWKGAFGLRMGFRIRAYGMERMENSVKRSNGNRGLLGLG